MGLTGHAQAIEEGLNDILRWQFNFTSIYERSAYKHTILVKRSKTRVTNTEKTNLESDSFPSQGFHKNLHGGSAPKSANK